MIVVVVCVDILLFRCINDDAVNAVVITVGYATTTAANANVIDGNFIVLSFEPFRFRM
jgi:hypothetical protein